jgi:hypothetical protein
MTGVPVSMKAAERSAAIAPRQAEDERLAPRRGLRM